MDWSGLLAILSLTASTTFIGIANLRYMRNGLIFGTPFSISRSRTPLLFRGGIILAWFGFAWMLLLTLKISVGIISFWFSGGAP